MIPVRLKLADFLSYRDPPEIDFTAFDVACVTGGNGRGKTALLSAMTFALFGAARGCEGGQHTERLVRDGAERASVELTFELGADTYRIVRTKAKGGRGDVRLLLRDEDGGWTNLAGENVRETEARIASLLRMDYQTFTASAFLLQGRADDFLTRMRPEERKDVLVRLLDLGAYARLEDASRAGANEARARMRTLAERAEQLSGVPAELAAASADLEVAAAACRAADLAARDAERALEVRRDELQRVEAAAELWRRERDAVEALETRLDASRQAVARKARELQTLGELLARGAEVRERVEELAQLEITETALREAAAARASAETVRAELAGRIEAEAREIAARRTSLLEQADATDREADLLASSTDRLQQAEAMLSELSDAETTLAEVRGQMQAMHAEGAAIGERIESIGRRRAELAERLDLLARAQATCPVCDGDLGPGHRKRLVRETGALDASAARDVKSCEARRDEVRKEWRRLREEEQRIAKAVAQREPIVARAAMLRAELDRVPERRARAAELRASAARLAEQLESGRFAQAVREELERVDRELAEIRYERAEHDGVRARMAGLTEFRALAVRIEESAARRETVAAERDELASRLEADALDLEHRRAVAGSLAEAALSLEAVRDTVTHAREVFDRARSDAADAASAAARLEERVERLRASAADLERARDEERACAAEHRRWSRLTQAFGRGGIPDLILENALPELRHEANEILGRLSDYEMAVDFQMRRDTKSGNVRETFDVLVHHDGGVRDFQMFSGGEAFRIAFAVRLGLSKLLVRRAGARLETLVIDEGFGTQDAEGRERLIEAIRLAREEFRKVLVITHLDELKDAFGTQLRVTKDARRGSLVEVAAS